jgi:hypothetical protein
MNSSNELYMKFSQALIDQLNSLKKDDVIACEANENLLLNISSLNKFLIDKNRSCLDNYIPASRIEYVLNTKLRGSLQSKNEDIINILDDLDVEDIKNEFNHHSDDISELPKNNEKDFDQGFLTNNNRYYNLLF